MKILTGLDVSYIYDVIYDFPNLLSLPPSSHLESHQIFSVSFLVFHTCSSLFRPIASASVNRQCLSRDYTAALVSFSFFSLVPLSPPHRLIS